MTILPEQKDLFNCNPIVSMNDMIENDHRKINIYYQKLTYLPLLESIK